MPIYLARRFRCRTRGRRGHCGTGRTTRCAGSDVGAAVAVTMAFALVNLGSIKNHFAWKNSLKTHPKKTVEIYVQTVSLSIKGVTKKYTPLKTDECPLKINGWKMYSLLK